MPPGREQADRSHKRHQAEFQSGQTRPGPGAHLSMECTFSDRLQKDALPSMHTQQFLKLPFPDLEPLWSYINSDKVARSWFRAPHDLC